MITIPPIPGNELGMSELARLPLDDVYDEMRRLRFLLDAAVEMAGQRPEAGEGLFAVIRSAEVTAERLLDTLECTTISRTDSQTNRETTR